MLCLVAQSCPIPWTVAHQPPLSMGFSWQECGSGLLLPSPRDLPNLGIEPESPTLQAESSQSEPPGKPSQTLVSLKCHPESLLNQTPGPWSHSQFSGSLRICISLSKPSPLSLFMFHGLLFWCRIFRFAKWGSYPRILIIPWDGKENSTSASVHFPSFFLHFYNFTFYNVFNMSILNINYKYTCI